MEGGFMVPRDFTDPLAQRMAPGQHTHGAG